MSVLYRMLLFWLFQVLIRETDALGLSMCGLGLQGFAMGQLIPVDRGEL